MLSLSCTVEGTLPEVKIPSDEAAFRYAICASRDWLPFNGRQEIPEPGKALHIRPSDKGRYLTALLRMSGGIHGAREIFLSKFWKDRFELLGATPKVTAQRVAEVTRTLRKRLPGGHITTEEEWERLANMVWPRLAPNARRRAT